MGRIDTDVTVGEGPITGLQQERAHLHMTGIVAKSLCKSEKVTLAGAEGAGE